MSLQVPTPKSQRGKKGYSKVSNNDEEYDAKSQREFEITSRWDSKMFDVKPATPKEDVFKLSDYFFEHIDRRTKLLVIPTFGIVAIGTICVIIIGVLGEINTMISLLIIIGLTWLGSCVGMLGVYRWGSVEDCTEFFKQKNHEYEDEVSILTNTKDAVKTQAKQIHFSVAKLKTHGEELEKNLNQFEDLRKELEKVCGKNEELQQMLDEINKQYDDWQELMYENEKAHLTSIYYETSLIDGNHGLTEKEYKRFLARLNKKTRVEFETQGGFQVMDKDGNGIVDLYEFQNMLDMVMESVNEDEIKLIKQRSHL